MAAETIFHAGAGFVNELVIAIGNLPVHIQVDNNNFFQRLESRFLDFNISTEETPAKIIINLESGGQKSVWEEPTLHWDEVGCSVTAPGVHGKIDGSKREACFEVSPFRSLQEIEHLIRLATAIWVYQSGGLLFHAAGISRQNKGYLFTGQSGAGKTTVCRVSRDVIILNDDLVVLTPQNGDWCVWTTPFTNPTQVHPNLGTAKLCAILNLVQDVNHEVLPIPTASAAADLMTHIPFVATNKAFMREIFSRCISIVQRVDTYELHFLPDDGFWSLIPL